MNRSQHPFTLTEIIVALGIFSLLMVLMLRFFTGAETLITSGEGRNTTYSDGRVAMDLIASLLRNVQLQDQAGTTFPFKLERGAGAVNASDKIAFYTQSPVRLTSTAKSNFYSVQIEIKESESGEPASYTPLIIKVADDQDGIFEQIIDQSSNSNPSFLTKEDSGEDREGEQEVVRYVTGLSFVPYQITTDSQMKIISKTTITQTDSSDMPNAIEIRLTMLSRENYQRYLALLPDSEESGEPGSGEESGEGGTDAEPENAKQFRLANEVEFTRTVLLPNANVLGE